MLVLLSTLIALGSAQHAVDELTFEEPASQLIHLIPRLSEVTDRQLRVSRELQREVVLLSVRARPVAEVLEKLADAVAGEWVAELDALVLTRRPSLVAQMERAEREKLRIAIDSAKVRLLSDAGDAKPFDESEAEKKASVMRSLEALLNSPDLEGGIARGEFARSEHEARRSTPIARATARLLAHVPTTELMAYPDFSGVVYSLNPRRFQRPFNPGMRATLTIFEAEQAKLRRALDTGYGSRDGFGQMFVDKGPILEAFLFVRKSWERDSYPTYEARLVLEYAAMGDVAQAETHYLHLEATSETPRTHGVDCWCVVQQQYVPGSEETTAEMRPISAQIGTISGRIPTADGKRRSWELRGRDLPPEVREALSSPDKHHRHSFDVSDHLHHMGRTKGLSLALRLPLYYDYSSETEDERPMPSMILGGLEFNHGAETKDGWCVLTAKYPLRESRNALDLTAEAAFLRSMHEWRQGDLDRLALLVSSNALPWDDVLGVACWAIALVSEDRETWGADEGYSVGYGDVEANLALVFWKTLPAHLKLQLERTGSLPYSALGIRERALLERLFFQQGQPNYLFELTGWDEDEEDLEDMHDHGDEEESEGDIDDSDYYARLYLKSALESLIGTSDYSIAGLDEATVALPQGLPADGVIRLLAKDFPAFVSTVGSSEEARTFFEDIESVAWREYMRRFPEDFEDWWEEDEVREAPEAKYVPMVNRWIKLQFSAGELGMEYSFAESWPFGTMKPVEFSQLPQNHIQEVNKAIERMRADGDKLNRNGR